MKLEQLSLLNRLEIQKNGMDDSGTANQIATLTTVSQLLHPLLSELIQRAAMGMNMAMDTQMDKLQGQPLLQNINNCTGKILIYRKGALKTRIFSILRHRATSPETVYSRKSSTANLIKEQLTLRTQHYSINY